MELTRHVRESSLPHGVCTHCGQVIVWVPDVGWIDPDPGDTYDMCPGDPYGNHAPAAA